MALIFSIPFAKANATPKGWATTVEDCGSAYGNFAISART